MAHVLLFSAAIAACLFWTAACVAAAARTERAWLRRLLAALGMFLPLILLMPWVGLTGYLAASGTMPTNNWLAPTLTAFLSASIGGWWICRAGLSQSASAESGTDRGTGLVAASWPLFGLASMYLVSEAVTYGAVVLIDHDALARIRSLRAEAAQLMLASLPPAPAADDDAAPLYERVFAALDADKGLSVEKSPLREPLAADIAAKDVQAILARHAATLELVRRAADEPGCRFVRDWSRPSIGMPLPEFASLLRAARLLALAARSEAAGGDTAAAVRDVARIHRIGRHSAGEPLINAGLVGTAIDTTAIETLAAVLPRFGNKDLPLLDDASLADVIGTTPSYQRHFHGEEAFGIATIADIADGTLGLSELFSDPTMPLPVISGIFRWFFMPAELAGYREVLHGYQAITNVATDNYPEIKQRLAEIDGSVGRRQAGLFGQLMLPALGGTFVPQVRSQALHRAADVLVAATRCRVATGSLPESAAALVPYHLAAVPLDPFTEAAPLRSRLTDDDSLVVYSVGPDGEDDGGPPPVGAEKVEGNDDVGLRVAR